MSTPQAGSFYPIYNSGVGQYIPPNENMPFDKISTLYVAFAHAYPIKQRKDATKLDFEVGQPNESQKLENLIAIARKVNPNIKILISLGWSNKQKNDWYYINQDYISGNNNFPASVANFIVNNKLDGFDIDDESVGNIPSQNFDNIIKNIRLALDKAASKNHKEYYLTATPAFGRANIDEANKDYFDMINVQNYGGSSAKDFLDIGIPKNKITVEIDSEGCHANFPNNNELAGIFNWTMSADSVCGDFSYTKKIAKKVGY